MLQASATLTCLVRLAFSQPKFRRSLDMNASPLDSVRDASDADCQIRCPGCPRDRQGSHRSRSWRQSVAQLCVLRQMQRMRLRPSALLPGLTHVELWRPAERWYIGTLSARRDPSSTGTFLDKV